MKTPVLILHGGAGRTASRAKARSFRRLLSGILDRGYEVLMRENALAAVREAVRMLEDAPAFNAGRGSVLQSDGHARLSAAIMDGRRERFAGVIDLERIRNPILVAHALLDRSDRVLAGPGAQAFARRMGMRLEDTRTRAAVRRWRRALRELGSRDEASDTVGACALDREGNLAAASSTGGRGLERPHRVSDSGMPISTFADGRVAVTASGIGEEIIEEGLAVKIAARAADGLSLAQAFRRTFGPVRAKGARMGAIGVDCRGRIQAVTTTQLLYYAARRQGRRWFF